MSQNISAKESWLQAFLQTEKKSRLVISTETSFEWHTLIRFGWCEVVPRVRVPDTPDRNYILARSECSAFGDQGILYAMTISRN